MELVVDKWNHFQEFYQWALDNSDKRVADWPLMSGYTPTLSLTAGYLVSLWIIERFMRHREPFQLKPLLILYNFGLVALNFHIFYEVVTAATRRNYSYTCQPVDYSDNPDEIRMAKALWWYYFSKCIEFLDTIFFLLRKKNNQVSFLHVYHHASMFPIWWMGIKWVAGGQSFFGAMINSFIHVIMYSYYGIAAMGPQYQKYLWWKRYLTKLQLAQFFVGMVYATQSLYFECEFPRWMAYCSLVYGVTIIALFMNFYIKAYIVKDRKIQFVAGMFHAGRSIYYGCDFPLWMQWALVFYGLSILLLFLNFYHHAYVKSAKAKAAAANGKASHSNGDVANGTSNGHVAAPNGDSKLRKNGDSKKRK